MGTRNVVLTGQQDALLARLVASGRYQNASEAIRHGLRLLETEEAAAEALLARIMVGYDQATRGEFVEGSTDAVFDRVTARARTRWAARQASDAPETDSAA